MRIKNWTQVFRFGNKCLYPLSHLAGPSVILLNSLLRTMTCTYLEGAALWLLVYLVLYTVGADSFRTCSSLQRKAHTHWPLVSSFSLRPTETITLFALSLSSLFLSLSFSPPVETGFCPCWPQICNPNALICFLSITNIWKTILCIIFCVLVCFQDPFML